MGNGKLEIHAEMEKLLPTKILFRKNFFVIAIFYSDLLCAHYDEHFQAI